jgi:hypothetical protein
MVFAYDPYTDAPRLVVDTLGPTAQPPPPNACGSDAALALIAIGHPAALVATHATDGGYANGSAVAGAATVAPPPSLPSAAAASDAAAAVAALLPSSHAAPWPLEPTPLDVTPADRELLAAQFADAGETLYCIACVYKLGERQKQSPRTLAIGEHKLLVLKPRKKGLLGATEGTKARQRTLYWHELLSCASSADGSSQMRLCFIPQQGRSSALPPLFLARLARVSGQFPAEAMWELMLVVKSPATMYTLLYCMRRAFEGIWRSLGAPDDERAPQLLAPQWQHVLPEHVESSEIAVRHAADAARAAAAAVGSGSGSGSSSGSGSGSSSSSSSGGAAGGSSSNVSEVEQRTAAFVSTLRHLCAYHDCALRDSVAYHLTRQLLHSSNGVGLDLSLLLRLPHTAPPPYVDLTPRRLSSAIEGGDGRLPTPKPAASIAEVRALAAALCCCGGVHGVQAIDVRLGEEAIMAFAEVLRFSTDMNALRLNHVTSNSNAARASMAALVDMLPNSRAPLAVLDLAHNAQLEESTLLRLMGSFRTLPRALKAMQLDGCGLTPKSIVELGAVLSEGHWPSTLQTLTLAHNSIGRDEGSIALAAALRCSSALTTLDVTHTGMDMPTLFDALLANEQLQRRLAQLHLGTNKLSRAAAAQLAELLSRAASLCQLGVSRTQLLPESFEPIFGAALANAKLSQLSIDASDNEFGERCARGLADQLRRISGAGLLDAARGSCGLIGLKMRSTSLTEGGVCALLEPLAALAHLVQLDLSANLRKKMVPWQTDVPADLGRALVTLVRNCAKLRSLALAATDKDAGTVHCDLAGLPDALADHESLTSVDLTSLKVEDPALVAIATALPRNRKLLTLALHGSKTTAEVLAADASVRLVLDRNRSSAAESAAGGGEYVAFSTGILPLTCADPSIVPGVAPGSPPGGHFGMPSRSELFKEVERSAYLEVSQKLPGDPMPAPPSRPHSPPSRSHSPSIEIFAKPVPSSSMIYQIYVPSSLSDAKAKPAPAAPDTSMSATSILAPSTPPPAPRAAAADPYAAKAAAAAAAVHPPLRGEHVPAGGFAAVPPRLSREMDTAAGMGFASGTAVYESLLAEGRALLATPMAISATVAAAATAASQTHVVAAKVGTLGVPAVDPKPIPPPAAIAATAVVSAVLGAPAATPKERTPSLIPAPHRRADAAGAGLAVHGSSTISPAISPAISPGLSSGNRAANPASALTTSIGAGGAGGTVSPASAAPASSASASLSASQSATSPSHIIGPFEATGNLRGNFGGALNALSPLNVMHREAPGPMPVGPQLGPAGLSPLGARRRVADLTDKGRAEPIVFGGDFAPAVGGLLSDPAAALYTSPAYGGSPATVCPPPGGDGGGSGRGGSAGGMLGAGALGGGFGDAVILQSASAAENAGGAPATSSANASAIAAPGSNGATRKKGTKPEQSTEPEPVKEAARGKEATRAKEAGGTPKGGGTGTPKKETSAPMAAPPPARRPISMKEWQSAHEQAENGPGPSDIRARAGATAPAASQSHAAKRPTQQPAKRGTPGAVAKAKGPALPAAGTAMDRSRGKQSSSRTPSPREMSETALDDASLVLEPYLGTDGEQIDPFATSNKVAFGYDRGTPRDVYSAPLPPPPEPVLASPPGHVTPPPPVIIGDAADGGAIAFGGAAAIAFGGSAALAADVAAASSSPTRLASTSPIAFGGSAAIAFSGAEPINPELNPELNPFAPSYKVSPGNGSAAVAAGGGALVGARTADGVAEVEYRQLIWNDEGRRQLPPGVNVAKLEAHLSDVQFRQVLGMDRANFYAMTKMDQMRIKQDTGLF